LEGPYHRIEDTVLFLNNSSENFEID